MRIRHADISDIDIISEYDKHISKAEIKNSISLDRIYIAEENGRFIGWLRYNLFWDNTPFMNLLYIFEEHREKGFGKTLVGFWENEMSLLGYKTVMTSAQSDEYAQHFYSKLGYKAIGGFCPCEESYDLIFSKTLSAEKGIGITE